MIGSGNGILGSTKGNSRVERESLVCVSRSFATTPMSPACSSPISDRSLPTATHKWFSFSATSRGAFQTSWPFFTVPAYVRKYVTSPTCGSEMVLKTCATKGLASSTCRVTRSALPHFAPSTGGRSCGAGISSTSLESSARVP